MWILCTAIGMLFYSVAEYFSKMYANGVPYVIIVAFIAYIACTAFWFPALKNNNQLVVMAFIWSIAQALITMVIGILMFKEHLNIMQTAGTVLAIGALALLGWK